MIRELVFGLRFSCRHPDPGARLLSHQIRECLESPRNVEKIWLKGDENVFAHMGLVGNLPNLKALAALPEGSRARSLLQHSAFPATSEELYFTDLWDGMSHDVLRGLEECPKLRSIRFKWGQSSNHLLKTLAKDHPRLVGLLDEIDVNVRAMPTSMALHPRLHLHNWHYNSKEPEWWPGFCAAQRGIERLDVDVFPTQLLCTAVPHARKLVTNGCFFGIPRRASAGSSAS